MFAWCRFLRRGGAIGQWPPIAIAIELLAKRPLSHPLNPPKQGYFWEKLESRNLQSEIQQTGFKPPKTPSSHPHRKMTKDFGDFIVSRKDATNTVAVSIFCIGDRIESDWIGLEGIARNPIPNSCHCWMETETTRCCHRMINRKSGGKKNYFTSVESPLTIGARALPRRWVGKVKVVPCWLRKVGCRVN